jgi:hypothetical protein
VLSLRNNQLSGTIPTSISELKLERLYASTINAFSRINNNNFSGSFPQISGPLNSTNSPACNITNVGNVCKPNTVTIPYQCAGGNSIPGFPSIQLIY